MMFLFDNTTKSRLPAGKKGNLFEKDRNGSGHEDSKTNFLYPVDGLQRNACGQSYDKRSRQPRGIQPGGQFRKNADNRLGQRGN